jgi:regulator of protease activity HflC (stomatin/prohibitin superfamily)
MEDNGLRNFGIIVAAIFVAGVMLFSCACEKIDVGNVGLKINVAGETRGVDKVPTVTGWVWYNPFTQNIIEFPTTNQTINWDKSGESSESVSFSSMEGMSIDSDVSLSFQINPMLAGKFYAHFKQPDLTVFAHGYLRNQVRDAIGEITSKMPVTEIYGIKKTQVLEDAKKLLIKKFAADGIDISQLTFNSPLRLPAQIQASIDASIKQSQDAQAAQNKVAFVEAEARQKVAVAEGDSRAKHLNAEAEAFSILSKAEAQAKATDLMNKALEGNNKITQYKLAEKWDGHLPVTIGGGQGMILDLRSIQQLDGK